MAQGQRTVLCVGPDAAELGGMASVVGQMLDAGLGHSYTARLFPVTRAPSAGQSGAGRGVRHVRHLMRLRRVVRETRAAIVHIHTCSGFSFFRSVADLIVAQAAGCRVVLHVHGASFDEFHGRSGLIAKAVIRWALHRADRVIALSLRWRAVLYGMAPSAKLTVIENAVAVPPPNERVRRDGPCRFLLLARMDQWKGIDDLLDAAAMLHAEGAAFDVTLAGPGGSAGDGAELERKISARGLETVVRYVGSVLGADKDALLANADVYVQPSHHEGMPIALLVALGHGLPAVATSVGAVPEVIEHEREGLLVPPRDVAELARAMRGLACDGDRRRGMGQAARALAERRFDLSRFHTDLVRLYDEILGERQSAARRTPRAAVVPT